ncbi:MAG: hypothetical protein MJB14_19390 [Spirochaetes bacterium]|nr:hypothetical protein [Spirochaetota bacterium]
MSIRFIKKILIIFNYIILFVLSASSFDRLYQSNYNGLELLEINYSQIADYQYYLRVNYEDDRIIAKYLYDDKDEIKRWEFYYAGDRVFKEIYYKDKVINELYLYDTENHKTQQEEYKNGKILITKKYQYNNEGLVNFEENYNHISAETTKIHYKYDSKFRIKQIIKEFPDGKIVYWDAFFTNKGIITKEYYTLNNETYIFFYNSRGQELKGEVITIEDDEEIKKIFWEIQYSDEGVRIEKEEVNYLLNLKTITQYNSDGREKAVKTYQQDELKSIYLYEYDNQGRVLEMISLIDLLEKKVIYTYDSEDQVIEEKHFENNELKKNIFYRNKIKTKEIIFSKDNLKIIMEYDEQGNLVQQNIEPK